MDPEEQHPSEPEKIDDTRKKVVVIGAGFGGVRAIRALLQGDVAITLLDADPYFSFTPRLTELVNNSISEESIVKDLEEVYQDKVTFVKENATEINLEERRVSTLTKQIDYDYLVVACGSKPHFFNIPGARDHSIPFKDRHAVAKIHDAVQKAFEEYQENNDESKLSIAVIGAGYTGVELACAVSEYMFKQCMQRDIDPSNAKIYLVQHGSEILPGQSDRLREVAWNELQSKKVDVRANMTVTEIRPGYVAAGEKEIPANIIVWTAGITSNTISCIPKPHTEARDTIGVTPALNLPHHPEVFVVGDAACFHADDGSLPPTAQVAFQEGYVAGKNILRKIKNKKLKHFHYTHWGTLMVLGRDAGILFNKILIAGKLGWKLRDWGYKIRMRQMF